VLLTGPPGTGKTTVAKVLAAQAQCSFYAVSAGDVTSMWLGESERNIQRLFERARQNRPSIFIDEIDAIASKRGEWGSYDRQINELLQEMDGIGGQQGVFVLAATNRPDQLDPALLRGGRLSRSIEIPLPDLVGRRALVRLFTKRMPLIGVNLHRLAMATEGASGADLRALCQQAALNALVRARREKIKTPSVTGDDFAEALSDRSASLRLAAGGPGGVSH
jgi:transitional endoplasmic reticulum ATPase